jgi:hypothetical protein
MRLRQTKNGHNRIADELLQRAAITRDDGASMGIIVAHQGAHIFGIERIAECG